MATASGILPFLSDAHLTAWWRSRPASGPVTSLANCVIMIPDAVLIQVPSIDFRTFIGLSHKVLGRSPSTSADACRRELSDAERFLTCLAAFRDERAPVGLAPHLLKHVSFSAFVGADDRDMLDILQLCAGMPFVVTDTIVRGVQAAVVTGTLSQWRDAIIAGCSNSVESTVRHCFNKLHGLFVAAGLNAWGDFQTRWVPDQTTFLLLDDKRSR